MDDSVSLSDEQHRVYLTHSLDLMFGLLHSVAFTDFLKSRGEGKRHIQHVLNNQELNFTVCILRFDSKEGALICFGFPGRTLAARKALKSDWVLPKTSLSD